MAAVSKLSPEARKLWFSNVRSRNSPWRWKNTARRSALLASPLFSPAWLCWRSAGSHSHYKVNRVRSMRPNARSARDSALFEPPAAILQDGGGRDCASLDRSLHAHQLRPAPHERRRVHRIPDQRLQQRVCVGLFGCVELALFQVLDAWREAIAQEVAQAEHVVRYVDKSRPRSASSFSIRAAVQRCRSTS